ncbi:MAG: hypothetical protein GY928_08350 [Colwellia sp.]|nr:hypothetical protein [Colwellia sp.]
MSIDQGKLENVKNTGSRIVARCPACAEQGGDKNGNHLLIDGQGRFSCVVYSGGSGMEHRKRIWALVGVKDGARQTSSVVVCKSIKVRSVPKNTQKVIKSNVLGRLGRVSLTHARIRESDNNISNILKELETSVPSVPNLEPEFEQSVKEVRPPGPITHSELYYVFICVMHKANNVYLKLAIQYVKDCNKELFFEIKKSGDLVEEAYVRCYQGKAKLKNYEDALLSYKDLCLQATDLYRYKFIRD